MSMPEDQSSSANRRTWHDYEARYRETTALGFDWLKHLTTLSFSAIVVITALLNILSTQAKWAVLIPVSLIFLLVSVLSAVATMLLLIMARIPPYPPEQWRTYISPPNGVFTAYQVLFFITIGVFVGGVISFAVFAIANAFFRAN